MRFQSPRTGKFESNEVLVCFMFLPTIQFQSPRSGKFESNSLKKRIKINNEFLKNYQEVPLYHI